MTPVKAIRVRVGLYKKTQLQQYFAESGHGADLVVCVYTFNSNQPSSHPFKVTLHDFHVKCRMKMNVNVGLLFYLKVFSSSR